jgi:hypothetical protein
VRPNPMDEKQEGTRAPDPLIGKQDRSRASQSIEQGAGPVSPYPLNRMWDLRILNPLNRKQDSCT